MTTDSFASSVVAVKESKAALVPHLTILSSEADSNY